MYIGKVSFCRSKNILVLAEGVETLNELKVVASLGIQFVQGYLLAKPGYLLTPLEENTVVLLKSLRHGENFPKE